MAFDVRRSVTRNRAKAVGTSGAVNRALNSYVVIPEMTITMNTFGGDILFMFNASFDIRLDDIGQIAIFVDGVHFAPTDPHTREFNGTDVQTTLGGTAILGIPGGFGTILQGIAAGSHTFAVHWKASSGTIRIVTNQRTLSVLEIL